MEKQTEQFEQWKDIQGYEGRYQVSNLGRVKSLGRTYITKNGHQKTIKGRILQQGTQSRGYMSVCLWKDNTQYTRTVHRLVMETFSPCFNDKLVINHINEDQTDNRFTNLHWCTSSYNSRHNNVNLRRNKKVYQYTKDLVLVREWDSATQVAEETSYTQAGISSCASGKLKTHGGSIWTFQELPFARNFISLLESEKQAA